VVVVVTEKAVLRISVVVVVSELVENAPVVVVTADVLLEWLSQRSHPQLSSRPLLGSP